MDIWQNLQDLDPWFLVLPPQSLTVLISVRIIYINSVGNAVDDQKKEILALLAIFTVCSWPMVGLSLGQGEEC